ncbi:MAG TPA: hypothetical protein VHP33_06480 [Polyangiaceae bacterium]|nr:hypothetical protein [Polyangiaceae bacterium]
MSGIPRLTEQLDGEELTAHFAVPRELLEQLRDDDDATRVQMMPAGLLEDEQARQSLADSVHTSPTLPPPAPQVAAVAAATATATPPTHQLSPPVVRVAFPPATDAELQAEVRAMRTSSRRALFVALLIAIGFVLLAWRLLSS